MTTKYYGVSTGETGVFGVGDIFVGYELTHEGGEHRLDGEPVHNWFTCKELKVQPKEDI